MRENNILSPRPHYRRTKSSVANTYSYAGSECVVRLRSGESKSSCFQRRSGSDLPTVCDWRLPAADLLNKRPLETAAPLAGTASLDRSCGSCVVDASLLIGSLIDHKRIVIAELRPRPVRDFLEVHEPPIGHVGVAEPEEIADCRGDIEPGALVEIWFGAFVAKNVLPVIGAERPGIFPLRVNDAITFANCNPTILARAYRGPLIGVLEPRNHMRRFRSMPIRRLVVVGQCTIKWILARPEVRWNVTRAVSPIRIIESAVAASPVLVPRTRTIRDRIISTRLLADPENRCHNFLFPRITFSMVRRILPARRKRARRLQQ